MVTDKRGLMRKWRLNGMWDPGWDFGTGKGHWVKTKENESTMEFH